LAKRRQWINDRRNPRDLEANAPNITYDAYNTPHNWNGAAPLAYYARFDAASGEIEAGQFLVPRLSSGKGNGSSPRHINADEDGVVVVAGSSACCMQDGSEKTINGIPTMPTYAGGAFVLVVSQDWSQRVVWNVFSGSASKASIKGLCRDQRRW